MLNGRTKLLWLSGVRKYLSVRNKLELINHSPIRWILHREQHRVRVDLDRQHHVRARDLERNELELGERKLHLTQVNRRHAEAICECSQCRATNFWNSGQRVFDQSFS